jgi:hypothetical protein
MAAPANVITTLNNPGLREDLENDVYRIAPEKTPFLANIKKKKATARLHEWQTRDLRDPDPENARLEGDDVGTLKAPNLSKRVGVYCQIFEEDGGVSGTTEVVDAAGRDSELDEQKMLKGVELRRDKEARYLGNFASQNESGALPRKTAGVQAWAESVSSRGVGGADGGFQSGGTVAAATNGTQRPFTEQLVKDLMATGFAEGAQYSQAYMGLTHKQQFSAFAGIADIRVEARQGSKVRIIGAADIYVSDFGEIDLIPHPYALNRAAVFIDPEYVADARLRRMHTVELAKNGDNERFMILEESCLVVENEKAVGVIADLS